MNAKHTMTELRGHLFDVIEKLKAPEPMDVQIAKTICLASQRLLESANVEIRFRHLATQTEQASAFLTDQN